MRIVKTIDGYTIEQGWTDELAHDLVLASHEETIQQFTPNDLKRRFKDDRAAQSWYDNPDKQPVVYALRDTLHRQLGGVAWFSRGQNKHIETSYDTTFAIRLYNSARGQGLSYPFARAVHDDYQSLRSRHDSGQLWLETSVDNLPAKNLYQKLGYRTLALVDEREIMGLHLDR